MTVRLAELPDINALEVTAVPAAPAISGKPLLLPCDLIDEDPDQPRTAFDDESLRELAATIAERGVRQPVSVRRHPTVDGRWMLNFGARRLRASKLAGKAEIPAFVDEAVDSYDQVIENEQRQGLKPLELALFVKRRLDAGDSQAEIARRLGKSRQYVMLTTSLIDAPDWLLSAYREGRCRDLNGIHELRRLADDHPRAVESWAADEASITREKVLALRARIDTPQRHLTAEVPASRDTTAVTRSPVVARTPRPGTSAHSPVAEPRRVLCARLDGLVVRVDADHVPSAPGQVFVTEPGNATRRAVEASRLDLVGFLVVDGLSL